MLETACAVFSGDDDFVLQELPTRYESDCMQERKPKRHTKIRTTKKHRQAGRTNLHHQVSRQNRTEPPATAYMYHRGLGCVMRISLCVYLARRSNTRDRSIWLVYSRTCHQIHVAHIPSHHHTDSDSVNMEHTALGINRVGAEMCRDSVAGVDAGRR